MSSSGVWIKNKFSPHNPEGYLIEINKMLSFIKSLKKLYKEVECDIINLAEVLHIEGTLPDYTMWNNVIHHLTDLSSSGKVTKETYVKYLWLLEVIKHTSEHGTELWNNRTILIDTSDADGWLIANTLKDINTNVQ